MEKIGICQTYYFYKVMLINIAVLVICLRVVSGDNTLRIVNPGRHVCMRSHQVHTPVKRLESYCQPLYRQELRVCDRDGKKGLCTSFRVVYKTSFREIVRSTLTTRSVYVCCPGWTQQKQTDYGCMKPLCTHECKHGGSCTLNNKCECQDGWTGQQCETAVCTRKCENGGVCVSKDVCRCEKGWTGERCHIDIDECRNGVEDCHHICVNTAGSYRCTCEKGFRLGSDNKSCKFCLECIPEYNNLVGDYKQVDKRLRKLEDNLKDQPPEIEQQNIMPEVINMDVQNDIYEKLRNALEEHVNKMNTSLKYNLYHLISSRLSEELESSIEAVRLSIGMDIKSSVSSHFNKTVIQNLTQFKDAFDNEIDLYKAHLQSFKAQIVKYNSKMDEYRTEVELYKNDLKAEMQKSRDEVASLKKKIEEMSSKEAEGEYMDYGRIHSLSEQIALLEERIAVCTCGG